MTSLLIQLLFLFGFPLLVVASTAYFTWGALRRPWLYVLVSLIVLYSAYALVFYFLAPQSVGYMVSGEQPTQAAGNGLPGLLFLEPYARPLLVFPFVATPIVLALLKLFKR